MERRGIEADGFSAGNIGNPGSKGIVLNGINKEVCVGCRGK